MNRITIINMINQQKQTFFSTIKKSYKINDLIYLTLEEDKSNPSILTTKIYVNNYQFSHCKYLLFNLDSTNLNKYDDIKSIDDMESKYSRAMEHRSTYKIPIDPEEEFVAHCSNIQAWVENDYDTHILHRNLAFPLLRELRKYGDEIVLRKYKEEIARRVDEGNLTVVSYLSEEGYLKEFTREEIEAIITYEKFPLAHEVYTKIRSKSYDIVIKKDCIRIDNYKAHSIYFFDLDSVTDDFCSIIYFRARYIKSDPNVPLTFSELCNLPKVKIDNKIYHDLSKYIRLEGVKVLLPVSEIKIAKNLLGDINRVKYYVKEKGEFKMPRLNVYVILSADNSSKRIFLESYLFSEGHLVSWKHKKLNQKIRHFTKTQKKRFYDLFNEYSFTETYYSFMEKIQYWRSKDHYLTYWFSGKNKLTSLNIRFKDIEVDDYDLYDKKRKELLEKHNFFEMLSQKVIVEKQNFRVKIMPLLHRSIYTFKMKLVKLPYKDVLRILNGKDEQRIYDLLFKPLEKILFKILLY